MVGDDGGWWWGEQVTFQKVQSMQEDFLEQLKIHQTDLTAFRNLRIY
jgi:hypothetical protein